MTLFNDRVLHGLGVLPYVICQAVPSDLHITCVHHSQYLKKYFGLLENYCHYHLGCSPEARFYNIANTDVVPDVNTDERKPKYVELDSAFVLESIRNMDAQDYHLFNVLDSESVLMACSAIQQELTNNAHCMQ